MIIFIFLFGLVVGSFLNCVIWRLHTHRNLWGRSQCAHCHKKIFWYDNIPVISFFVLGGKCRHCRKSISFQYPLVELSTAILFAIAYNSFELRALGLVPIAHSPQLIALLRNFIFISFLITIFVFDFRYYYILDTVTIPAAAIALIINIAIGMGWQNLIFGGIIGGGVFLAQFLLSRGKWIGGGDIRLGVVMGLMLGWNMVLLALFFAYTLGAVISIILVFLKYKKFSSKVPFGAFLSAATIIVLLYGERMMEWYFRFMNN